MKSLKFLTTTTLLAASPWVLNAASVTFSDTVSMPNDTTVTINLPKFDNSIGGTYQNFTLDSVTVTVRAIITGANVQMDNDSVNAQTGTARVQNLVNSYSGPSTPTNGDPFTPLISSSDMQLNANQNFSLGGTSGDTVGQFDVTGFSDYASWTPGTLQAGDSGLIDPAGFSIYSGPGSISFSINSTYSTSATFSGENGFFQGNTPTGDFFVEVTYAYTVPEPSSFAMIFGLMAAGLIGMRRRLA